MAKGFSRILNRFCYGFAEIAADCSNDPITAVMI